MISTEASCMGDGPDGYITHLGLDVHKRRPASHWPNVLAAVKSVRSRCSKTVPGF